jgi:hypothetical protein
MPGGGLREFCADCGTHDHIIQRHGIDGVKQLQLPRASQRRSEQFGAIFKHSDSDDGSANADRAFEPDSDSSLQHAD